MNSKSESHCASHVAQKDEREPVAWLETEPGVTLEQIQHPMYWALLSTITHVGEYPKKTRPENELFPLYAHPCRADADLHAQLSEARATIEELRATLGKLHDCYCETGHFMNQKQRMAHRRVLIETNAALAHSTPAPVNEGDGE